MLLQIDVDVCNRVDATLENGLQYALLLYYTHFTLFITVQKQFRRASFIRT